MTPAEAIRNRLLAKLGQSLRDLPALPAVVIEILRETNLPSPSASVVEDLLRRDQALTVQILRVVNSPYYGLSGQIGTVSQAVMVLGLNQVRNLVLGVGASTSLSSKSKGQEDTFKRFWQHAFATATTTQILKQVRKVSPREAEVLYVGGLIHDIGRLFLSTQFAEPYQHVFDAVETRGITMEDAETEIFGMNHSEVGEALARQWEFPEPLLTIVGKHEGPFSVETEGPVHIVHVADALNKHFYFPMTKLPEELINPDSWAWFDFDTEKFERISLIVAEKVEEASEMFTTMAA